MGDRYAKNKRSIGRGVMRRLVKPLPKTSHQGGSLAYKRSRGDPSESGLPRFRARGLSRRDEAYRALKVLIESVTLALQEARGAGLGLERGVVHRAHAKPTRYAANVRRS